ncbi:unnamed protein product [Brassica rapa]|uniref:Uncharacterized protein n=1 Tax=Brassica campestris TaxID=3711 RepID=A0A8D9I665_BRACM|nr:unnamed protein product [Brassica rapa]
MASAVVSAAFRLPFPTRRLSNHAPLSHRCTFRFGHLRRIITASSMSQQSVKIGSVVDASRNDENSGNSDDEFVIATKPYPKSQVSTFFKKLKLCK